MWFLLKTVGNFIFLVFFVYGVKFVNILAFVFSLRILCKAVCIYISASYINLLRTFVIIQLSNTPRIFWMLAFHLDRFDQKLIHFHILYLVCCWWFDGLAKFVHVAEHSPSEYGNMTIVYGLFQVAATKPFCWFVQQTFRLLYVWNGAFQEKCQM